MAESAISSAVDARHFGRHRKSTTIPLPTCAEPKGKQYVSWPGRRPRRPHNARQSGASRGAHRHPQLVPNLAATRHASPRVTTGAPAATPTPHSPVKCGKSTWRGLASEAHARIFAQSSGRVLHHVNQAPAEVRCNPHACVDKTRERSTDRPYSAGCRPQGSALDQPNSPTATQTAPANPPYRPAGETNSVRREARIRAAGSCARRSTTSRLITAFVRRVVAKAAVDATPSGTSQAEQHTLSEEEGCQLSPLKPTLQNGELWGPRRPIWRR